MRQESDFVLSGYFYYAEKWRIQYLYHTLFLYVFLIYVIYSITFILVLDNTKYWLYYNSGGDAGEHTIQEGCSGTDCAALRI